MYSNQFGCPGSLLTRSHFKKADTSLIKLADDMKLRERGGICCLIAFKKVSAGQDDRPNPQERKLKGIFLRSGTWIQKEHRHQRIKDVWLSGMEKF